MKQNYYFSINDQGNKIFNASNSYGHDASIIGEGEDDKGPYCFFTSPHLTKLTNPIDIWARGLSLMALFRGATNIFYYNPLAEYDNPIEVNLVRLFNWETGEDLTPLNTSEIVQAYPFDSTLLDWYNIMVESNVVAKAIYLSKSNDDILHLLLQFGNGHDWINLYSILDSLKTFSSRHGVDFFEKLLQECNHSKAEIDAFTGTANNYGLIGVSARHGEKGWKIPKNTITLKEAQCIIGNICRAYLKLIHHIK